MAWSSPPTFVSGNALTAAQLNVLSGDLNETAPAKASAAGQLFVSTGLNTIAARTPAFGTVLTTETTTSSSWTNLATTGPSVTVTTGSAALVIVGAEMSANQVGTFTQSGYAISGATTIAPSLDRCVSLRCAVINTGMGAANVIYQTGLTPGSNTFTEQYQCSSGGGTGSFLNRRISVIPL